MRSGTPATQARIAEERESVSRSAVSGWWRRISPAAAKRRARDHGRYGAEGNRGSIRDAKDAGPRNTAGREGSEAAARTTGQAWMRSPSQFGRRTRSGRPTATLL